MSFRGYGIISGDGLTPVIFNASVPTAYAKKMDVLDLMGQFIGNGTGWILENGVVRPNTATRPASGIICKITTDRPIFKASAFVANAVKVTNFYWLSDVPGEEMIISAYVL